MSTARDKYIARGGRAKLAYGLAIEGVKELFVSDRSRSHRGSLPWALNERVAYDGLSVEGLTIEESADWPAAQLDAAGCTVTIRDVEPDSMATWVFGGRPITRRTFSTEDLDSSETTWSVVSTAGWGTSGDLYLGRETCQYTVASTTTFTVTRGCYGSTAHGHLNTVQGDLEITDVPITPIGRLAQIYLFVDDENVSPAGTVVWRGIVRSVSQTSDGLGWSITLGHISEILKQHIGAAAGPFPMRGFYFPTVKPLAFTVHEYDGTDAGDNPAKFCAVSITGYYPTIDSVLSAISVDLDPATGAWTDTAGAGTTPTNQNYVAVLAHGGTCIAIRYLTHAVSPKYVDVFTYTPGYGRIAMPGFPRSYTTGPTWVVGATSTLSIVLRNEDGETIPDAFTYLEPTTYEEAPEDGTGNPANRIYHAGAAGIGSGAISLTHVTIDGGLVTGSGGSAAGAASGDMIRVLAQGVDYLTVQPISYVGSGLASYPDNPVMISPILTYGTRRWDEMLRTMATASTDDGPDGETAWLPTSEFDWTSIERESVAAGCTPKEWRFYKAGDLEEIVQPELLAAGLCWATNPYGKLTVRRIAVASSASHTSIHINESDHLSPGPNETPTITANPDGIVNDVRIKGGWDPREEKHTRIDSGATMRSSWQSHGRKTLTIEPRGADMTASLLTDASARAQIAATLVATYAFPYYVARLSGLTTRYAGVLVGDIVAITDRRLCWQGVRGVTLARGQVARRSVALDLGRVDLEVRLSDWNAAAYAPAARIRSDGSGLTNSNLTVEYRGENAFSPVPDDASTFYDGFYFQVGDVCRLRQIDTTSATEQSGLTIVSVNRSAKTITFDTAITLDVNTATKRFVLSFDSYDAAVGEGLAWEYAPAVAQHDYAFIADASHTLGTVQDRANLWGP